MDCRLFESKYPVIGGLLLLLARGSKAPCITSGDGRGVSSCPIAGEPAALVLVPSIIALSRSSRYGPVLLRERPPVASEFARLRVPVEDAGERPGCI